MASTTDQIQHPSHDHPLLPRQFSKYLNRTRCRLCRWKISSDCYACEECGFFIHRACAEAPPRIDRHPLHTDHPLTLRHCPTASESKRRGLGFLFMDSTFRCDECDFDLNLRRALSTLSDQGGHQGKTPEQIELPLHQHVLTSFSTRHEFIGDSECVICKESVDGEGYICLDLYCDFLIHKRCVQDLFGDEYGPVVDISCGSSTLLDRGGSEGESPKWIALPFHKHLLTSFSAKYAFVGRIKCVICEEIVEADGYMCLHWKCECSFLIHKRCVPDLYYTDGTKAPQVYHPHPLETFGGEDIGSARCVNCGSEESSGEFIGCERCGMFIHRNCVQVPNTIQYPHHPDHTLFLFIDRPENNNSRCDSCSANLEGQLCYACPSCKFFVHVECAIQVVAFSEQGMSAKIELSWHEHPLFLCHRNNENCCYCEDILDGPIYACKEQLCNRRLHQRCTEIESTILHPHHPDHTLTLCNRNGFRVCGACSEFIRFLNFSCDGCRFYLHAKCIARVPTRKHALHEHELLQLEKAPSRKCNRCRTRLLSPFFRCVPCDFNLHETCMDLPPQVLNSKVHWHRLTLHETYLEDDSGEYYCDQCEQRRDGRMGVYVCLQCSQRWTFHIECVLPELRKVCGKNLNAAEIERLARDITEKEKKVREVENKLDEVKRELDEVKRDLDEQRKKYAALIDQ